MVDLTYRPYEGTDEEREREMDDYIANMYKNMGLGWVRIWVSEAKCARSYTSDEGSLADKNEDLGQ